jgi:hypothetical protein
MRKSSFWPGAGDRRPRKLWRRNENHQKTRRNHANFNEFRCHPVHASAGQADGPESGHRFTVFGAHFPWLPTAAKRSSCPKIRCSSTRCAISWACIWTRPIVPWSCAWMKRVRFRHWTGPHPCCPCALDRSNAARTTMSAMARPSLFAALNTRTGKVIGQTQQRHRSEEFRKFLDTIEANVPAKLDVHLILDNYGTHKTAKIPQLAGQKAALSPALHAHLGQLAQPGRAMVCRTHRKTTPPRCPPLHQGTTSRYRGLHQKPQQQSKTLRMAQNR